MFLYNFHREHSLLKLKNQKVFELCFPFKLVARGKACLFVKVYTVIILHLKIVTFSRRKKAIIIYCIYVYTYMLIFSILHVHVILIGRTKIKDDVFGEYARLY